MILKQKRGESSGKKVSSAIQRKQEYAKKHSNSLARAATQVMSASERTSPTLQVYRFRLINKQTLMDSTDQEIRKDTALLSRLQFNYSRLKDNLESISKEDYQRIYQRQYKNKNEIADKLMQLMRGEQNRIKSEPMRPQTIEDLQKQIQALMTESTDQVQRRYRQKKKQAAEELQKKYSKLNIEMLQLQKKLAQYDQTLKYKTSEITYKLQELQKSQQKKQENYQTLKENIQNQLVNLKIIIRQSKDQKFQYLSFVQENILQDSLQYEKLFKDKSKIITQQFKNIEQRIIKNLQDQKSLKIRDQFKKIKKQQKIVSNINSQIKREKINSLFDRQSIKSQTISLSGENNSSLDLSFNQEKFLQKKNQQYFQKIEQRKVLQESLQIKHQQSYVRKEPESQQERIKKYRQQQCQIIEKQYLQKKQEKIEQNKRQMQNKIKEIKSYYESLAQQRRLKQLRIKKQIKEKDQMYLQFQTQKKKQLQLIKNEGQQEKQRYFAAKQNFRQQIQKYRIKIKQRQQQRSQWDLGFKAKNQKLKEYIKEYIKAKILNAQTQSAEKLRQFQQIYQRLFVKIYRNNQIEYMNYPFTKLPLRKQLQDYAFWLKGYQKLEKEREKEKRQLDEKKHKQIQSEKIKFKQMIKSLNECRNNAENIWFTEQVYQSTKKDLQLYNTFIPKRQKQLSSLQRQIHSKDLQITQCKQRLEKNNKKKDCMSKQVSLFRKQIVDMQSKRMGQRDEKRKKAESDLSGEQE